MEKSTIAVVILAIFVLLVVLYLSHCLKKQKDEIKILERKCVKFNNRESVEEIVEGMDKVKMLMNSSSEITEVMEKIKKSITTLAADNERSKQQRLSLENTIKEQENSCEKKIVAVSESLKKLQYQIDLYRSSPLPPSPHRQPAPITHPHQLPAPITHPHQLTPPSPHPHHQLPPHHNLANPQIRLTPFSIDQTPGSISSTPPVVDPDNLPENLAIHTKDCPRFPVDIKFAEDVAAADVALENSILQNK